MAEPIYSTRLDKRFDVTVMRTGDYTADLSISESGKVLLSQPVTLSYGAEFGPDAQDVAEWQRIACAFIDGLVEGTKQP